MSYSTKIPYRAQGESGVRDLKPGTGQGGQGVQRRLRQKPRERKVITCWDAIYPDLAASDVPTRHRRAGDTARRTAPSPAIARPQKTASRDGRHAQEQATDITEIVAWLGQLAAPGQCVGLWIKETQIGIVGESPHCGGYFTDMERLAKQALVYDGQCFGVYVSLNPVDEDRLDGPARRRLNGKVTPYVTRPDNSQITCRRFILIECDPKRDDTFAATAEEKELAHRKAMEIARFLESEGWPKPMIIDSGNGTHLLYRIDLPADDGGIVQGVLAALAERFDDDRVTVDTHVSPSCQLVRLPGTMNCKGTSTPERPHRRSHVLSIPQEGLQVVPNVLLEKLAASRKPIVTDAQTPRVDPTLIARAQKYLEAMPEAMAGQGGSLGRSLAALAAARAITVDFNIPCGSDEAWQLLLHYNTTRCRPPWMPQEYADLRRKLADADAWATENSVDRGRLLQSDSRLYSPLPGPLCPMSVPDYDLMAQDTPELVIVGSPFKALRMKAAWDTHQSDAQVPDVFVRWAYWGAKAPKNWRYPYLEACSGGNERDEASCDETCPLKESRIRHRHFRITRIRGLKDQLDEYGELPEERDYTEEAESASNRLARAIKKGLVYHGYWPALIFGTSPRVGLSVRQSRLLMAVTRELTRLGKQPTNKFDAKGQMIYHKPKSDRADRAEIISGSRVQNSAYTSNKLVCPSLDKRQRYVAFCGNYKWHRGRGYTFAAWLERAGYASDFDDAARFMADLAVLAEKFDLVVVGRHHDSQRWCSLEQMQAMIETRSGRERFNEIMLRIYGPADFLTLWRYRFAQWLGFRWIPGAPCPFPLEEMVPGRIACGEDLKAWMKKHDVTQAKLAELSGMRRETINRNLKRTVSRPSFWSRINEVVSRCDG